MRLCLNMIVKNESARIERALKSALPYITSAVIVDTGSTDDTKRVIQNFCDTHHLPLSIEDAPFEDWSQARNAALAAAREYVLAAAGEYVHCFDYLLLIDADMELVVKDKDKFFAAIQGSPSYDMYQVAGVSHYQNRRLVHAKETGLYTGRTHEYLNIDTGGLIGEDVAYFIDHSDGANRPGKFERDIRLLLQDLEENPKNERAMFYLAQSYRDAGNLSLAAMWFKRRIEAGGWGEEVWQAHVHYAHCLRDMGDEAGFIKGLLEAYNYRPTRAESLYDLAKYYRDKSMAAPALMAAEAVVDLPLSKDALFVNNFVYDVGLKEEVSISAFYVPNKKRLGYKMCSDLAMNKGAYDWVKHGARANLYHYVEPLSTFCPSFKWERIPFEPPENWIAMNPSITSHLDRMVVNVRCVNYRIDSEGRYLIRGTDGTAHGGNPINTRNFVMEHFGGKWCGAKEVFAPDDMPCEWPLVIGFEDMRLISWQGELWSSSTVRQLHADGNCEQVLTRLEDEGDRYVHANMHRMLRQPRETQKNWSPVVFGDDLFFMYRPGELVDTRGFTTEKHDYGVAVDNISGSSQLIPLNDGWLAVTHEANYIPGRPTRYYTHRFFWYSKDFKSVMFSLPFYFHDRQIEFVAGMCEHGGKIVISYGYRDEEARLATVDPDEIMRFFNVSAL